MLFKSTALAALVAAASVVAQNIPAAEMLDSLNRLTVSNRIANQIVSDVYLDNPGPVRQGVIGALNATALLANLNDEKLNGQNNINNLKRSGTLAARASSSYTSQEQADMQSSYATVSPISFDLSHKKLTYLACDCCPKPYNKPSYQVF
jgi:hypothetical protein